MRIGGDWTPQSSSDKVVIGSLGIVVANKIPQWSPLAVPGISKNVMKRHMEETKVSDHVCVKPLSGRFCSGIIINPSRIEWDLPNDPWVSCDPAIRYSGLGGPFSGSDRWRFLGIKATWATKKKRNWLVGLYRGLYYPCYMMLYRDFNKPL